MGFENFEAPWYVTAKREEIRGEDARRWLCGWHDSWRPHGVHLMAHHLGFSPEDNEPKSIRLDLPDRLNWLWRKSSTDTNCILIPLPKLECVGFARDKRTGAGLLEVTMSGGQLAMWLTPSNQVTSTIISF
jgi:hypothetical protein